VEKALQLAKDSKICGKKMHASKFEVRTKKSKKGSNLSENDGDSEDSNE
jgi:hypothetical protein